MQLGVIGLGRMGANIVRRLMRAGHECVVYDRDPRPGAELSSEGATVGGSLASLVGSLKPPRAVWVMLPSGAPTEATVDGLSVGETHRRYSSVVNARLRVSGHLFQSRFGSVVMDEEHLIAAAR